MTPPKRGYRENAKPVILITRVLLGLMLLIAPFAMMVSTAAPTRISISKVFGVQLSKVDDWNFGVHSATTTALADMSVTTADGFWDDTCAFSSSGAYDLDVSSQNGGSLFIMKSGTDQIPYTITVSYKRGTYQTKTYTASPISLKNLRASQITDCADEFSGHNLRFAPLVAAADFNAAPPGVYQDIVTLVVSPK